MKKKRKKEKLTCGCCVDVVARGPQGFWTAYPPMKEKGIEFPSMSNPKWFDEDVRFAWGFWGAQSPCARVLVGFCLSRSVLLLLFDRAPL